MLKAKEIKEQVIIDTVDLAKENELVWLASCHERDLLLMRQRYTKMLKDTMLG